MDTFTFKTRDSSLHTIWAYLRRVNDEWLIFNEAIHFERKKHITLSEVEKSMLFRKIQKSRS